MNLYAYCDNNPVGYYDPSGYCGSLCDKKYNDTQGKGSDTATPTYDNAQNRSVDNQPPRPTANVPNASNDRGSRSKDNSYSRPSKFRNGVKKETWKQAVEASEDGIVRSPGGKIIQETDRWQMGHKPGYEFKKHKESAEKRSISREEFLNEHNIPEHYRPELPEDNLGHKYEGSDDLNFWDE